MDSTSTMGRKNVFLKDTTQQQVLVPLLGTKMSILGTKQSKSKCVQGQGYHYEGRSESSNNCLIIQLIFIVKQKETYFMIEVS